MWATQGRAQNPYEEYETSTPDEGIMWYQVFVIDKDKEIRRSSKQTHSIEELPSECHRVIAMLEAAAHEFDFDGRSVQRLADIEGVGYIRFVHHMSNRDYYLYEEFLTSQSEV